MPECDGRKDRQTDRQTCINIALAFTNE